MSRLTYCYFNPYGAVAGLNIAVLEHAARKYLHFNIRMMPTGAQEDAEIEFSDFDLDGRIVYWR